MLSTSLFQALRQWEDAKEKGMRKVGMAGKRKRKGERACIHFFYI